MAVCSRSEPRKPLIANRVNIVSRQKRQNVFQLCQKRHFLNLIIILVKILTCVRSHLYFDLIRLPEMILI